jgi:hypothetical protein
MSSNEKNSNYVIIDDILVQILINLNVRQLLRLERVSKQFEYCVNYVLKRQQLLFIGNVKKCIFCECFKSKKKITKGNITKAFNEQERNHRIDLSETENKLQFNSLLKKFSHLKSLYLNDCTINAETIQTLFDSCHRLQCIGFYNIYCDNGLNEWQRIARIMSNKVIDFSTNERLFIRESDGNIVLYPIREFVKYLTSLKELDFCSYFDNEEELFKNLPKTIRFLCITRGIIGINSINQLIESNKKGIVRLWLCRSHINEEVFVKIYKNLNLENFSFSCETLSLKKISEMAKFQKNLKILKIIWCRISYYSINTSISFSKVHTLRLIACSLNPKVMESIGKLFLNLKRLDLSYCKIVCECNQEMHHNYRCIECHHKFVDFLSKMMIKVLHLHYSDISHSLIHSLKNFQKLQTIEVIGLLEAMNELQNYRLTQLTEAFIEISRRDLKKLFTIQVNKITSFANNISFPRNCHLLEYFD